MHPRIDSSLPCPHSSRGETVPYINAVFVTEVCTDIPASLRRIAHLIAQYAIAISSMPTGIHMKTSGAFVSFSASKPPCPASAWSFRIDDLLHRNATPSQHDCAKRTSSGSESSALDIFQPSTVDVPVLWKIANREQSLMHNSQHFLTKLQLIGLSVKYRLAAQFVAGYVGPGCRGKLITRRWEKEKCSSIKGNTLLFANSRTDRDCHNNVIRHNLQFPMFVACLG